MQRNDAFLSLSLSNFPLSENEVTIATLTISLRQVPTSRSSPFLVVEGSMSVPVTDGQRRRYLAARIRALSARNVNTSIIHSKSGERPSQAALWRSEKREPALIAALYRSFDVSMSRWKSSTATTRNSSHGAARRRRGARRFRRLHRAFCIARKRVSLPPCFSALPLSAARLRRGSMQPLYARTSATRAYHAPTRGTRRVASRRVAFRRRLSRRPFLLMFPTGPSHFYSLSSSLSSRYTRAIASVKRTLKCGGQGGVL